MENDESEETNENVCVQREEAFLDDRPILSSFFFFILAQRTTTPRSIFSFGQVSALPGHHPLSLVSSSIYSSPWIIPGFFATFLCLCPPAISPFQSLLLSDLSRKPRRKRQRRLISRRATLNV